MPVCVCDVHRSNLVQPPICVFPYFMGHPPGRQHHVPLTTQEHTFNIWQMSQPHIMPQPFIRDTYGMDLMTLPHPKRIPKQQLTLIRDTYGNFGILEEPLSHRRCTALHVKKTRRRSSLEFFFLLVLVFRVRCAEGFSFLCFDYGNTSYRFSLLILHMLYVRLYFAT
jgi:hypothetical protein